MPPSPRGLGGLTSADTVISLVIPPRAVDYKDVARAILQVRAGYAQHASDDCDVVVLAVPHGKGTPYVDAMAEAVEATASSRIILPGR